MPRSPLFLKFSEYSGIISIMPFRRHQVHYPVAVAFTFPEGNYLFFVYSFYIIVNDKRYLFPGIEYFKILYGMQAYFRVSRCLLGSRTSFSYYKLTFSDI